jgi:hypothetical protein
MFIAQGLSSSPDVRRFGSAHLISESTMLVVVAVTLPEDQCGVKGLLVIKDGWEIPEPNGG